MSRNAPSLRTTFALATILVTTLCLVVAGALIVLTTMLQRTTNEAVAAVETLRLTEEAEIDLLLLARSTDRILRHDLEVGLRKKLASARGLVTSSNEVDALDDALARVDEYLTTARSLPDASTTAVERHEAAYLALERLADINVHQSQRAQGRAAQWTRIGGYLGFGTGFVVLPIAAIALLWLRRRAFNPVLDLAETMQRFGKGDFDARVRERGASELRAISLQFNEMATALSLQRQAQIAFVGGVAHDLRNPLSALRMSAGFIRPGAPLPPEAQLRKLAAIMDRQLEQLNRMIGDFLDIAKLESGQLELRLDRSDARRIVRNVIELFDGTSSVHQLKLVLPSDEVSVTCDALRLEQVLTNLVSNAIKYSPKGGDIDVTVEGLEHVLVVSVTDRGLGIAEKDLPGLFEPFRRVGLSKGSVPGVGLGLYVVNKIVEAHGGTIDVTSTLGRGSTFTVRLPR